MKSILVAIDGSETANKALREAKNLADFIGCKVTIINVASIPIPLHITYDDHMAIAEQAAKRNKKESLLLLDQALKVFDGFTGEVKTLFRNGDPGEEIIEEAEKGDYDLIIMGSRGRGIFTRTILGSISNKVLNHTNKNVLIIK